MPSFLLLKNFATCFFHSVRFFRPSVIRIISRTYGKQLTGPKEAASWICPGCHIPNSALKTTCVKCQSPRALLANLNSSHLLNLTKDNSAPSAEERYENGSRSSRTCRQADEKEANGSPGDGGGGDPLALGQWTCSCKTVNHSTAFSCCFCGEEPLILDGKTDSEFSFEDNPKEDLEVDEEYEGKPLIKKLPQVSEFPKKKKKTDLDSTFVPPWTCECGERNRSEQEMCTSCGNLKSLASASGLEPSRTLQDKSPTEAARHGGDTPPPLFTDNRLVDTVHRREGPNESLGLYLRLSASSRPPQMSGMYDAEEACRSRESPFPPQDLS